MGGVYQATARLTGELVALKQVSDLENLQIGGSLLPDASQSNLRLALAREFQLLAGLHHPHIISVLEWIR